MKQPTIHKINIKDNDFIRIDIAKRFLLVEDGSVDIEQLNALNIPYLVYRQGSTPPRIIRLEGDE